MARAEDAVGPATSCPDQRDGSGGQVKQKWWLIAAGLVGIGLAILLFPKPDTGSSIPDPTPGRVSFDAAPEIVDGDQRAGSKTELSPLWPHFTKPEHARRFGESASRRVASRRTTRKTPSAGDTHGRVPLKGRANPRNRPVSN